MFGVCFLCRFSYSKFGSYPKFYKANSIGISMKMTAKEIALVGIFGALSVALQLSPLKYPTPWGMKIDLVAVPILMAFFLFGFRIALLVNLLIALVIVMVSPDSLIGASAKFTATLPMYLLPAIFVYIRKDRNVTQNPGIMLIALVLGILVRGIVMIPLNYYVFLPIWLAATPEKIMSFLPWWAIFLPNAIQGSIDVILPWLLIFRTKAFNAFIQ